MTDEGYDIIGDVHGTAGKLEQLLSVMGYSDDGGAWKHPTRRAVFVGDFIDRGPRQLDAVGIPRAMVEAGSALAVIGNHEFNAASLATKDRSGEWNRRHSERNLEQSSAFLDVAPLGSADHAEIIEWFMTLPLWLDLDGIQVVHACWHPQSMAVLEPILSTTGSMTHDFLIESNVAGSAPFDAMEVVLKGPEAHLDGYRYADKDGHERTWGRVTWWDAEATTLATGIRLSKDWQIYDPEGQPVDRLPETPLPDWLRHLTPTDANRTPVCFGHYWFREEDGLEVIDGKAACVDFSAVKGGPLVAYRWSGESELTSDNIVGAG